MANVSNPFSVEFTPDGVGDSSPPPPTTDEVLARVSLPARSYWKRWAASLALLVVGGGAGVLGLASGSATPMFRTASIARRDLRVMVTASGTLEALTTVEVGTEVSGRLLTLNVAENETVERGQLLAEIDPQDLKLAVAQTGAELKMSAAEVLRANASLAEATSSLARNKKLRAAGLLNEQMLEAAVAERARALAALAMARAKVELAQAALELSRSRLRKASITSPIDGVVLSRLVEPGQTLTAGFQTPLLFKLAKDLTQLRLKAAVTEADIGRLKVGQAATFEVDAYPGRSFASRVVSLANEADIKQGVVSFRATLAAENVERLLRPGMTCTVQVVAAERAGTVVVPNAALRYEPEGAPPAERSSGAKRHVWLLEGELPRAVEIEAGATDGSFTEIVNSKLPVGSKVIVEDGEAT
jgi:HlyD family secretion protein